MGQFYSLQESVSHCHWQSVESRPGLACSVTINAAAAAAAASAGRVVVHRHVPVPLRPLRRRRRRRRRRAGRHPSGPAGPVLPPLPARLLRRRREWLLRLSAWHYDRARHGRQERRRVRLRSGSGPRGQWHMHAVPDGHLQGPGWQRDLHQLRIQQLVGWRALLRLRTGVTSHSDPSGW
jgi:hypothetical protein